MAYLVFGLEVLDGLQPHDARVMTAVREKPGFLLMDLERACTPSGYRVPNALPISEYRQFTADDTH